MFKCKPLIRSLRTCKPETIFNWDGTREYVIQHFIGCKCEAEVSTTQHRQRDNTMPNIKHPTLKLVGDATYSEVESGHLVYIKHSPKRNREKYFMGRMLHSHVSSSINCKYVFVGLTKNTNLAMAYSDKHSAILQLGQVPEGDLYVVQDVKELLELL